MKRGLMAVLFLLLVACGTGTTDEPQATDFRYGTEGLYMNFVPNLPPPRLFDNQALDVLIQVENRGTSNIADGMLYLSGFDPAIVTGISSGQRIPLLEGRGPFMPQGAIDAVSFKGRIASLSGQRIDKYPATLLATACYSYETVATAQVCIDPNPFAPTRQQKVCTPAPVGTGSQGAPVAVTTVEVDPAPGKTRFRIGIQSVGGGDVFRPQTSVLAKCSPYSGGLGFDDVDYIQVVGVSVSGVSIECRPLDQGYLRLTNGQGQLFCETTQLTQQTAYLTPLNIQLRYGYRQSMSVPVEIRAVA